MKKYALVTGAAGGIGRAMVQAFTNHGYAVVGLDKLAQPEGFEGQHYVQVDLQKLVEDDAYQKQTHNTIKPLLSPEGLSVLVNNAAVQVLGGVESLTVADWQRTLNVNLLAPFVLTQGLLQQLQLAKGCVINISSIHARLTKPNFMAYATSKAALSGMTRAMAVDVGPMVRVNAIEPAAIATGMLQAGFEGRPSEYAELERCHPQGRIGTPAEVAALALSMVDGELRFLHGACVGMDGGLSARLHDPA